MSTIKVDTIATRTGSGNITLSNNVASLTSAGAISGTNISASGTLAVTGDATFDTSTLKVDSSNNRVGIGTASPASPLHMETGTTTDIMRFGTGGRWGYQRENNDSRYVSFNRTMGSGGSNMMTFDGDTGYVGIGNTTTPTHPLHVTTSTDGTGISGDDKFVAVFQNAEATDDRSYGLKLMAGSTINDQTLTVQDHDGTKDMFTIKGNGLHSMYLSSSDNNYVVNANPSAGGAGTKQWNLYYKSDSSVFTGYHYYAKKEPTILYADGDTIPSGKKVGDVKTQGETFEMGDVIVYENGKVTKCTKANATNVVGIYSGHPMPGGRWLSNDKDDIATEEHALEVASVGDSQDWNKTVTHYLTGFKVCNENGAIASGDLLCSASKTGYLMKQDGTAITSETVGKSMDTVSFDSDGNATGVYGFLYCG